MAEAGRGRSASGGRRTRVQRLADELRSVIAAGGIPAGGKLPSEAALTAKYGVSRTVVREAVAALRSEGLVDPRQGAGVFVTGADERAGAPFAEFDADRLSSLVEMMEFRIAVEAEAAALAAQRRSPAQEAAIVESLDALGRAAARGEATGPLDFAFHLAVARATNNPRFERFLDMLGTKAIPRARIGGPGGADVSAAYFAQLSAEHREIAAAISARDDARAREAMRLHLARGLQRYRDGRQSA